MDIVKKNWLSITFGVIAILAIVGDFYPMAGKRQALKAEATEHASKAATLHNLLTSPRNLPIVKPGNTEAEPLNGFPTAAEVEEAQGRRSGQQGRHAARRESIGQQQA